ncbi:MAG TPA: ATPase, T2SS/T4P/T4SS family [Opitutaceae bacterium]|nr:ATPase, T2SS/T4P/T4SS family [Opitutaceae bacterium]
MTAFPILDLLEQATAQPGTTDATIKSTGTVAVCRNASVSVTNIPALAESWSETVAALLPQRPGDVRQGYTTIVKDANARRYRMTISANRQGEAISVRPLPKSIRSPEELRLPDGLKEYFTRLQGGLFLVGGVTGSGKTWTLASLMKARAADAGGKFITIESPIEFEYEDTTTAVFHQREVGVQAVSYSAALEDALQEKPNVLMVQEIRRREEAETVLAAALSGHVVAASIHAYTASTAPQRFLGIVSPNLEDFGARDALASCLEAVVLQRLIPGFEGLVPIFEVLYFRNDRGERLASLERLVRQGNWVGLRQEMEVSKRFGMLQWEDSLAQRRREGLVPL